MTRRAIPGILLVVALASAAPAALSAGIHGGLDNTLVRNGRWIAAKTLMGKPLMGAYDFLYSGNALAGGRLDLGSWHGFQEVVYRDAVDPAEITFRFKLDEGAVLVFEFGKDDRGFSGLRFCAPGAVPGAYLTATDEGRFVDFEPLDTATAQAGRWHRVRAVFGDREASAYLDGRFLKKMPAPDGARRFGFRGGLRRALVDRVVVRTREGRVLRENFENFSSAAFGFFLALFAALNLAAYALFSRHMPDAKKRLMALATAGIVLSVTLGSFFAFDRFYASSRYFPLRKTRALLEAQRKYWAGENYEAQDRRLGKLARKRPDGLYRIVFVGTSQTWGAGARNTAETFVARVEKKLNERGAVECVNFSRSGVRTTVMLDAYRKRLASLEPDLAVLVFSTNESSRDIFEATLERFVDANAAAGVPTVFVLEANAPGKDDAARRRHPVMRRTAEKRDVPLLDLNGHLEKYADTGFVWWDFVHLTSYGHALAADFLAETLAAYVPVKPGS